MRGVCYDENVPLLDSTHPAAGAIAHEALTYAHAAAVHTL
jgi:hypothetical protein